ncbi:hypothetical protein GZ212_08525 [Mangrovimonas sp. CR14]|uniref:hypothetical protein n=1 Tax=Mangrovimonas sp. CR14 TaxID=2706120 RepID=UPI00141F181B|nr:hypothetical protein [Mangrovimonas sp. CR14]NIK92195.1 hypothetical protein [Mangrovimonas sp. CR14]
MNRSNILGGLIFILLLLFIFLEINQQEFWALSIKSFIVPVITFAYLSHPVKKSKYFTRFLVLYTISELTGAFEFLIASDVIYDVYYYVGNLLYFAAYSLLLYDIYRGINLKEVFRTYKAHLIVLSLLNVYIIYTLINIAFPMSSLVDAPKSNLYKLVLEFGLNLVVLLLLTFSLIGYLYKDNKKALLLFFGSLSIVFSEVIIIAYYYISEKNVLNIASTILFTMAFLFYYKYALTPDEDRSIFAVKS